MLTFVKRMLKNTLACPREREANDEERSPLGGLMCVREDAASHLVLIEAPLELNTHSDGGGAALLTLALQRGAIC